MALVMVILLVATLTGKIQDFRLQFVSMGNVLALYSMVSFSLSAVMSVPQVVKGLDGDPRRIKGAIAAGTGINLLLILVITVTTLLGAGNNISENGALVDLSKELGGWVSIVGYVFSLLALATSFWANTLNLRDVVCEQTRWGTRAGWALSSFPCLLIALMGITSFVGFVRLASIVQVLTGIGVIVAYHRARKREGFSPICGRLGGLPLQILVVAGSLAATVGALLKIS